jgi:hypothetical protein
MRDGWIVPKEIVSQGMIVWRGSDRCKEKWKRWEEKLQEEALAEDIGATTGTG